MRATLVSVSTTALQCPCFTIALTSSTFTVLLSLFPPDTAPYAMTTSTHGHQGAMMSSALCPVSPR
jgi:hypothetical protein